MKNEISTGVYGVNIAPKINENFDQLFANKGYGMTRFNSVARQTLARVSTNTIRISIWADSIFNSLMTPLTTHIQNTFSDKTIEFRNCQLGGTDSEYHSAMMWEIINFNPDLIIIEEVSTTKYKLELMNSILKKIVKKTSSDVIMCPANIYGTDMQYLYDGNISAWKTSISYQIRRLFKSMCLSHGFEFCDYYEGVIRDLLNKSITPMMMTTDNIHPTTMCIDNYLLPYISSYFSNEYEDGYQTQNMSKIQAIGKISDAIVVRDISDNVTLSGTWSLNRVGTAENEIYTALTAQTNAYAEYLIEDSIGFEASYYAGAVGVLGILINGAAPSTLLKDYASPARDYLDGIYKMQIDTNVLANAEIVRNMSITMDTLTTYTVRDVTNNTVVGTGNTTSNGVFALTGGQITIPFEYAGVSNFRNVVSGKVYTFTIRKNWYDSISITNEGIFKTVRIFGLNRGNHTIKFNCNSGSIILNDVKELR